MNIEDLRHTVKPKSDQLNADDLIGESITVTIQNVRLSDTADQPIILDIGGGYQPYKPCKSMRRLMIFAWGKDGRQWIGRSMTLYNDPTVTWAGQAVGGIRISHLSHIEKQLSVALTATRGKRKPFTVKPLKLPDYPAADFDKNLPAWKKAIESEQATAQEIINKVQQKGLLTAEQKQAVIDCEPKTEQPPADATEEDLPDL